MTAQAAGLHTTHLSDWQLMPDDERLCPVCRKRVSPTKWSNSIPGHFDGAGRYCPGSFHNFEITLAPPTPPKGTRRD